MYDMKIKKITLTALSLLLVLPISVQAQDFYGRYTPAEKEEEKDEAARPIPKIFSSQVTSHEQASALDLVYYNLRLSLWNAATADFRHQDRLNQLISGEKFKLTRYKGEFEPSLKAAMDDLNKNYKKMQNNILRAEEDYDFYKERIRPEDIKILDKVWQDEIEKFRNTSNKYFKMQNKFLQNYRKLIGFILKNGGRYYYDSRTGEVKFYRFGDYQFFGKKIDSLKRINYKQKQFLRKHVTVELDTP